MGLGAKSRGVVVDMWKCVGSRQVVAIMNFESVEQLDESLSFKLPMMKRNGHNVKLQVTAIRDFKGLQSRLNEMVE